MTEKNTPPFLPPIPLLLNALTLIGSPNWHRCYGIEPIGVVSLESDTEGEGTVKGVSDITTRDAR